MIVNTSILRLVRLTRWKLRGPLDQQEFGSMEDVDIALFPEQATTTAAQVDAVFYFLTAVCGLMGLLVAFLLIFFCVRYRRSAGSHTPPRPFQSRKLEWFWTITPLGIFIVMFLWGAEVYLDAYRPSNDSMRIYGIGKQWMWKFQHPEGQREINTLHVPTGRPIQLFLISEDVIHSFFVPEFRIHMDLLPNRYTSLTFKATRPGTYNLFCAEYCGTNHSGMRGKVVVMEPADYENWLAMEAEGSLALEGRKAFLKYRCLSCHSADQEATAPVLENLIGKPERLQNGQVVTIDEAYIRRSIIEPDAQIVAGWQNIMPTFKGQITEEEIFSLIAYFRSLKAGETPERVETFPPPRETPEIN